MDLTPDIAQKPAICQQTIYNSVIIEIKTPNSILLFITIAITIKTLDEKSVLLENLRG